MVVLSSQLAYTPIPSARLNEYKAEIERIAAAVFGNTTNLAAPTVKVRRTSNQTLTTTSDILVIFQAADDDPGGMWDAGTPNRLTIQTPGLWAWLGQQRHDGGSATGVRSGKILYGGTSVTTNAIGVSPSIPGESAQPGPTLQVLAFVDAAAGQPVYMTAFQSSGGNRDIETDLGGTFLAGFFLGP